MTRVQFLHEIKTSPGERLDVFIGRDGNLKCYTYSNGTCWQTRQPASFPAKTRSLYSKAHVEIINRWIEPIDQQSSEN